MAGETCECVCHDLGDDRSTCSVRGCCAAWRKGAGQLAAARAVLKEVEWSGAGFTCPLCHAHNPEFDMYAPGHAPDCRLAALLAAARAAPEEKP